MIQGADTIYLGNTAYTLEHLTRTHTGLDNTPESDRVAGCLVLLANCFLQPIYDHYCPPVRIGAYRNKIVNAAVGGAPGSDHLWGGAVDFRPIQGTVLECFRWVIAHKDLIPYGQVIWEKKNGVEWIHGSLQSDRHSYEDLVCIGGHYRRWA